MVRVTIPTFGGQEIVGFIPATWDNIYFGGQEKVIFFTGTLYNTN